MSPNRFFTAAKQPKKVARLVDYKLRGVFGHSGFTPYIILTKARTGSNLLVSLLDSHPNVRAEGELFRKLGRPFYGMALSVAFSRQPRQIRASGFKIFYSHTSNDGFGGVWPRLAGMDSLAVIHLKRRNVLRTLVSRKIAQTQDIWLVDAEGTRRASHTKAVSYTPEELQEGFERTRFLEEQRAGIFNDHPLIDVYYEDLVSDMEGTFRQLTDFLKVPYVPPRTRLRRQNPERLRDLLVNYDELRLRFRGTQWEPFFDD